jgi:hypothetical protein
VANVDPGRFNRVLWDSSREKFRGRNFLSFLKNNPIEHIALSLILWYQERMLCSGRNEETEKTYIFKNHGSFLKEG